RPLGRVHTMQHENTLGRVDANSDNLTHGRLLCLRSLPTSFWHTDAVGGRPPHIRRVACESLERQLPYCFEGYAVRRQSTPVATSAARRMGPGSAPSDRASRGPDSLAGTTAENVAPLSQDN